jgi:hypothetical protein
MGMSIKQIIASTTKFQSKRKNPADINIISLLITPFQEGLISPTAAKMGAVQEYRVLVRLIAQSERGPADVDKRWTSSAEGGFSSTRGYYRTFVLFTGIKGSTKKSKEFPVETPSGIYLQKISPTTHIAKYRCDCQDYRWRFAYYNDAKADALYGVKPPPYKKKTQRPPVNPQGIPGACKHLMNVFIALKQGRILE